MIVTVMYKYATCNIYDNEREFSNGVSSSLSLMLWMSVVVDASDDGTIWNNWTTVSCCPQVERASLMFILFDDRDCLLLFCFVFVYALCWCDRVNHSILL